MKLKAVEKLCRAAGRIYIFDEGLPAVEPDELAEDTEGAVYPRQWMSDGVACYPLDGFPYLDEEAVCAVFDVNAKQRDKLVITHKEMPEGMDFGDLHPGDGDVLEPIRFQMSIGGEELYLLRDASGALLMIKDCYRKPFDAWKECECYKRVDKDGRPYVAVMSGCVLRGCVYPYRMGEDLVETLGAVYNAAAVACEATSP